MIFLFWLLLILSVFSYFIYPVILTLLNKFSASPRRYDADDAEKQWPDVTLIVTAYNEEHRIQEKIENTLALIYPDGNLKVVVASDSSTDATDSIVESYADKNVHLVRAAERLGKENAQLTAIKTVDSGIIVFSDVATKIEPDGIVKLVRYFDDPQVGAISSEDRFISKDGSVAGEGAYVKYEMWLRKQESMLAGLVGLSGSFFAARVEVCKEWDIHSPSDFNTALNCARAGYKAVTAPDVLGFYTDLADPSKEYARKIRTVIRGMTALERHPEVLNPFSFGTFAFQVVSHKLLRWTVPWTLLALFIVTPFCMMEEGGFYALAYVAQLLFYGIALLAHWLPSFRERSWVKIIYFFTQVNIALFDASIQFLSGKRMTVWQPSAR
ncbi:glycosyltransferase family 2 protein [Alteromonas pelagimontana]|uniref:Glycosyltransferase family 2 protein n=1 Tax=Alteromonas pelagimontana TaxID=1858656 RepID=A0A6M4MGH1_9ALTE|nr:glycosyltransferase family 2 protein [Alteromonas pelagimontana]QJR81968.1 glycosyltransferase family 2 protein [Alteromonas pelagimontana]